MYPSYQQASFNQYGGYQSGYNPSLNANFSNPYQMTTAPRVQMLAGRLVSSPEEITVQDVPGDGSVGWFPSADGSCVYGKRWTADGIIQTVRFVPEQMEQPQSVDPFAALSNKVDMIMQMLENMGGSEVGYSANGSRNASKKPANSKQPDAKADV